MRIFPLTILFALTLSLAACGSTPVTSSPPETVVVTVPFEVTRVVEVQQTVEVTRQVLVTQMVEIPVTVTPSPSPEASPTPEPTATATFSILNYASPTATFPEGKVQGFAPLRMVNQTGENLLLYLNGPIEQTYGLPAESERMETVKEGQYTYIVSRQEQVLYQGTINITNPDKHELHIRDGKVVFLVP
jgi:hypothetical protein